MDSVAENTDEKELDMSKEKLQQKTNFDKHGHFNFANN